MREKQPGRVQIHFECRWHLWSKRRATYLNIAPRLALIFSNQLTKNVIASAGPILRVREMQSECMRNYSYKLFYITMKRCA